MRGLPSILSLFCNEINKFNKTGARILDSIYHMTLKHLKIAFFGVKMSRLSLYCTMLGQALDSVERSTVGQCLMFAFGWAHRDSTGALL